MNLEIKSFAFVGGVYRNRIDASIEVIIVDISMRGKIKYKFLNTGYISQLSAAGFDICYQLKLVGNGGEKL